MPDDDDYSDDHADDERDHSDDVTIEDGQVFVGDEAFYSPPSDDFEEEAWIEAWEDVPALDEPKCIDRVLDQSMIDRARRCVLRCHPDRYKKLQDVPDTDSNFIGYLGEFVVAEVLKLAHDPCSRAGTTDFEVAGFRFEVKTTGARVALEVFRIDEVCRQSELDRKEERRPHAYCQVALESVKAGARARFSGWVRAPGLAAADLERFIRFDGKPYAYRTIQLGDERVLPVAELDEELRVRKTQARAVGAVSATAAVDSKCQPIEKA